MFPHHGRAAELRGAEPPRCHPPLPPTEGAHYLKSPMYVYIYIMVVRQFSPWRKGHPERWGAEAELGAFWMGSTPQLSIITAPTKRSLSAGSHGGTDTINNLKNINNLGFFFLFLIASPPPPPSPPLLLNLFSLQPAWNLNRRRPAVHQSDFPTVRVQDCK